MPIFLLSTRLEASTVCISFLCKRCGSVHIGFFFPTTSEEEQNRRGRFTALEEKGGREAEGGGRGWLLGGTNLTSSDKELYTWDSLSIQERHIQVSVGTGQIHS